jgi:ABC-type nitrate/sulfonate/bicarbonate transport system substrate-binding protein
VPQTQFARVIAAQAKDYYAAENLNVIFVPSGPDVDNVAIGGGSGHYPGVWRSGTHGHRVAVHAGLGGSALQDKRKKI